MQQGMKTQPHFVVGTHSHLRSLWWPIISSQLLSKIRGTSQFICYPLKTAPELETVCVCVGVGMHGLGDTDQELSYPVEREISLVAVWPMGTQVASGG